MCADEKLLELGLDPQTTRQQLHPASNTTTTTTSSSSSSSTPSGDITDQQTPGYSSQETAAGTAAKVRCLQVLSGFWDAAVQVVQTTPAQSLVEHGIYTRPASKMDPDCFGKGRVVVIGDAAHPMRPWGQSVSQALEDAWALGRAVQECVSVSDSSSGGDSQLSSEVLQALLPRLQAFRVQRAERLRPVVAFTTESGKAAYDAVKGEGSQQAAAEASVRGPDGDSMTADVFTEFCCDVEFERLHAG
jgi:2-polyprenyl-6-methoxyphenol hydroxylase-like FAD-dependent oxidoreductase